MLLNNNLKRTLKVKYSGCCDDLVYNPEPKKCSYYQICQFKNHRELYGVRKYIFNEYYDILDIKVKYYPTNDLNMIDRPYTADLMNSSSTLLID